MSPSKKYFSIFEAWRLPLSRLLSLALLAALVFAPWHRAHDSRGNILFASGLILVGIGAMGRLWCSVYIGGRKTTELVTEGPYAWCRNPLYFFSLLGALGVGLTTRMWFAPVFILAFFAMYYPLVIRSEEAKLRAAHGESFEHYRHSTPTFIPRSLKMNEASERPVDLRLFRKHLGEAVWFIWAVALVMLLDVVHTKIGLT